jgi:AraC-like DNA-binding protein
LDVLSQILGNLRIRGSVYFLDRLAAPWEMAFCNKEELQFHMVRDGECFLSSKEKTTRIRCGDLIIAAPGVDHFLSGNDAGDFTEGSKTVLLCGYCQYDTVALHPVVDAIPSLAVIRAERLARLPWINNTLDQLSSEFSTRKRGSELIINKLTEILMVELVRANFGSMQPSEFVEALGDQRIRKALSLLHERPNDQWTIESLGQQVAMSRTALAQRFKSVLGQPMFHYLTAVRMQCAETLLELPDLSLHDVASRVGYKSEVSFTKAFRKATGLTPSAFRRHLGDQPDLH